MFWSAIRWVKVVFQRRRRHHTVEVAEVGSIGRSEGVTAVKLTTTGPNHKSRKSRLNRHSKPLPPLPPASPRSTRLSTFSRAFSVLSPRRFALSMATVDLSAVKAILQVVYDYEAQSNDEIDIKEDQLVYLLDDSDEDWSKIQHHLTLDDLSATPQPKLRTGLVPAAYLSPFPPLASATGLYDYDASGDGELSIKENDRMTIYLREDEWIFVGINRPGKAAPGETRFGYIPGNYVEEGEPGVQAPESDTHPEPEQEQEPESEPEPEPEPKRKVPAAPPPAAIPYPPPVSAVEPSEPVASKPSVKTDPVETWSVSEVDKKGKKKKGTLGVGNGSIFFASDSDKAPVEQHPSSTISVVTLDSHKPKHIHVELVTGETIQFNAGSRDDAEAIVDKIDASMLLAKGSRSDKSPVSSPQKQNERDAQASSPIASAPPPRFLPPPIRTDSAAMAAKTKTRGVHFDSAPPVEISPRKGPRSDDEVDDTDPPDMQVKLTGLGDPALALYDFDADGDDELSVKEGDQLLVIDREGSDEWWKCKDAHGREGVVPASYLELQQSEPVEDLHRQEEEQETKARKAEEEKKRKRLQEDSEREIRRREEERRRVAEEEEKQRIQKSEERRGKEREREAPRQRDKEKPKEGGQGKNGHRPSGSKDTSSRPSLEKPKPTNTRVWHDRSGQFKVEAELLRVSEGMIRLHKVNGVVIEVPLEKMSKEDLDFIERLQTTRSRSVSSPTSKAENSGARSTSTIDEDNIPLGQLSVRNSNRNSQPPPPPAKKSAIDWFDFFLSAGCDMDDSTRYAASFERDKIDVNILPDIKPDTLRALGLREGDIIRVSKQIEHRGWKLETPRSDDPKVKEQLKRDEELALQLQKEEYSGKASRTSPSPNLFAGPGGVLKNNTRRGRPTPTKSASLAVDADALASASNTISRTNSPNIPGPGTSSRPAPGKNTPPASGPPVSGFGDDAWTPRPASSAGNPTTSTSPPPAPPAPPAPALAPPAPAPPSVAITTPAAPAVSAPLMHQQATGSSIPRPATSNAPTPSLPNEFDNLAKIGQWRPPSAPVPPTNTSISMSHASPPPLSFSSGLGMGSHPAPMGNLLQAQQTGVFNQPPSTSPGPRGPLAPVPANQGLLAPLIPTNSNFTTFIPTRPSPLTSSAMSTTFGTPSILASQPTGVVNGGGFGQPATPLQFHPTGVQSHITGLGNFQNPMLGSQPSLMSQPSGLSGFINTGSGFNTTPQFTPQIGIQQPPGSIGPSGMFGGMSHGSMSSNNAVAKDTSPANIFASMKAGMFANDSASQPADKYDALRTNSASPSFLPPQPTGWAALNALQTQQTGLQPNLQAPGFQPIYGQPTGYQPTGFGNTPGFGFNR